MLKKWIFMLLLWGMMSAPILATDFTYVNDTQSLAILNSLADRLMTASHLRASLHIGILDYNEVNAFATAGPQIFFTRRLLQSVTTEEELAAVLAHELGHLSRRLSPDVTRSFVAVEGDESHADQVGLKMLSRIHVSPEALWVVLTRVSDAWGNNMPSAQHRQLMKRIQYVAKKAHVDHPQIPAIS